MGCRALLNDALPYPHRREQVAHLLAAAQLGQLSPADRRSVYEGLIRGDAFVDPNVVCEIIRAMTDTQARALVNAATAGPMT